VCHVVSWFDVYLYVFMRWGYTGGHVLIFSNKIPKHPLQLDAENSGKRWGNSKSQLKEQRIQILNHKNVDFGRVTSALQQEEKKQLEQRKKEEKQKIKLTTKQTKRALKETDAKFNKLVRAFRTKPQRDAQMQRILAPRARRSTKDKQKKQSRKRKQAPTSSSSSTNSTHRGRATQRGGRSQAAHGVGNRVKRRKLVGQATWSQRRGGQGRGGQSDQRQVAKAKRPAVYVTSVSRRTGMRTRRRQAES
jgi:hypothetical protein